MQGIGAIPAPDERTAPGRQSAHMIHVVVEATKFFVHGCCIDRSRRRDAERAQHYE